MSLTERATTMRGSGYCPGDIRERAQRQPVIDSQRKRKSWASVTYGPSTARREGSSSSTMSNGPIHTGAS
eukprot:7469031-Alexandrium_andersonii.AAC.1